MASLYRLRLALVGERGSIATYWLVLGFAFFLVMLTGVVGFGLGLSKQAQAKYQWFVEALDFAARAPGVAAGEGGQVVLDTNLAAQYFAAAMQELVGNYTLVDFRAVEPGDPVPHGTAQAPGFVARVRVPVFAGTVPFVGPRYVEVPMAAYAVAQAPQL